MFPRFAVPMRTVAGQWRSGCSASATTAEKQNCCGFWGALFFTFYQAVERLGRKLRPSAGLRSAEVLHLRIGDLRHRRWWRGGDPHGRDPMGRTSTDFVVAMVITVSAREGNVADRAKDLLCLPRKRQSGLGRSQRLARSIVCLAWLLACYRELILALSSHQPANGGCEDPLRHGRL